MHCQCGTDTRESHAAWQAETPKYTKISNAGEAPRPWADAVQGAFLACKLGLSRLKSCVQFFHHNFGSNIATSGCACFCVFCISTMGRTAITERRALNSENLSLSLPFWVWFATQRTLIIQMKELCEFFWYECCKWHAKMQSYTLNTHIPTHTIPCLKSLCIKNSSGT